MVNDVNSELMGILQALKDDPEEFIAEVEESLERFFLVPYKASKKDYDSEAIQERREWYYAERKAYWANPRPAQLYLLMRLGFNGIWQTCKESKGLFGTPAGLLGQTRQSQILNPELLRTWSRALQDTSITAGDYSHLSIPPGPETFVFRDPPYRDSFTTYGVPFDDTEQERLLAWVKELVAQGARVALSNRVVPGDSFFEDRIEEFFSFTYLPVTYTAGRRRKDVKNDAFEAKKAVEFWPCPNSKMR